MSRLTNKEFIDTYEPTLKKLCELENIEEELGVDLVVFLTECVYVLKNSNSICGYTTKNIEVCTDYGYVVDFIKEMKKAIKMGESEK